MCVPMCAHLLEVRGQLVCCSTSGTTHFIFLRWGLLLAWVLWVGWDGCLASPWSVSTFLCLLQLGVIGMYPMLFCMSLGVQIQVLMLMWQSHYLRKHLSRPRVDQFCDSIVTVLETRKCKMKERRGLGYHLLSQWCFIASSSGEDKDCMLILWKKQKR